MTETLQTKQVPTVNILKLGPSAAYKIIAFYLILQVFLEKKRLHLWVTYKVRLERKCSFASQQILLQLQFLFQ